MKSAVVLWCLGLAISLAALVHGHERDKAAVEKYKADGTYDARLARTMYLQQHMMSQSLQQKAAFKMKRAELESRGLSPAAVAAALSSGPQMAFPFGVKPELKSTGARKTLTILVDFKDQRASVRLPNLTVDTVTKNVYGTGTPAAAGFKPLDSLHNYYDRASQGKVNIQGSVLGWHSFPKDRSEYEPEQEPLTTPEPTRSERQSAFDNAALFELIAGALDASDATHDFTQYDNDGDGDIDLVNILYAGPNTGWGSFWWAYRWEVFNPTLKRKFDGKYVKQFVFQFVDVRGTNGSDFNPETIIHEIGHAFGLPDFYDYKPGVPSPDTDGGVGGLDMMDANQGNHCAFSRWLLDWIDVTSIGAGPPTVRTLTASASTGTTNKAIAIFPGLLGGAAPGQEMFIVENRHRIENDKQLPGDGLLIWHIDATANSASTNFAKNNSDTDHKLIKLVRADSVDDFGDGDSASSAAFFVSGKEFSPTSVPSSKRHDGTPTGVTVKQISAAGESITAQIGFQSSLPPTPAIPLPAPPVTVSTPPPPVVPAAAPPKSTADLVSGLQKVEPKDLNLDWIEALDHALADETVEKIQGYWKQLASENPKDRRIPATLAMKVLLSHWAAKEGGGAVKAVLSLQNDDKFMHDVFAGTVNAWSGQNPSAAGKWYLDAGNRTSLAEKKLSVDESFTVQIFSDLFRRDEKAAVTGLESLDKAADIVGALKAMRQVSRTKKDGLDKLHELLEKLKDKSERIKATDSSLRLKDAAVEALYQIKDLGERAKFQKLLDRIP